MLVGFMGAGKTTIGNVLAQRLGWRFVDLDDRIEAAAGRTIAEIFADQGEAEFRRLETVALGRVLAETSAGAGGAILALGGGAFVQHANRDVLRSAGALVVFLDAPPEVLMQRCLSNRGSRPLFRDQNQFRQLYERRRSAYMRADHWIDTQGRSVEQVAADLAGRLGTGIKVNR